MGDRADLGGHWDGIYNYPRTLPPTAFTATLRDHGGAISGEISEPGREGTLFALIDGRRAGSSVTFVKFYDDHHARPIRYAGTLNADATEITGTWNIPGDWSGTFIMVRQKREVEEAELKIAEEVER
jgi:hypothetical protein